MFPDQCARRYGRRGPELVSGRRAGSIGVRFGTQVSEAKGLRADNVRRPRAWLGFNADGRDAHGRRTRGVFGRAMPRGSGRSAEALPRLPAGTGEKRRVRVERRTLHAAGGFVELAPRKSQSPVSANATCCGAPGEKTGACSGEGVRRRAAGREARVDGGEFSPGQEFSLRVVPSLEAPCRLS